MVENAFELIAIFSIGLLFISSFFVSVGSVVTRTRIFIALATAFLGGFILVFSTSELIGFGVINSFIYATLFGAFSAAIFIGIGFLSRRQRDWAILLAQKQFQKTLDKHEAVDVQGLLHRYRSGEIELHTMVNVLESQQYQIRQTRSSTYADVWDEYCRNLEIASAELSYGEIPCEEIQEYADQQVRLFLEFLKEPPD